MIPSTAGRQGQCGCVYGKRNVDECTCFQVNGIGGSSCDQVQSGAADILTGFYSLTEAGSSVKANSSGDGSSDHMWIVITVAVVCSVVAVAIVAGLVIWLSKRRAAKRLEREEMRSSLVAGAPWTQPGHTYTYHTYAQPPTNNVVPA
eukprot:TRINITY_DN13365_c0_g1_i2.p1 TRINITY_DN13365_c0_g1~~TRINITY_DN13365_c0_g1_i2.p1  ORF type:complete len:147 (-),score=20.16 TRINITY_DN13365_c0_g1_i2:259-699(-)